MKKTNIKRIAAFTASILAVAALAVPMTSVMTVDAAGTIEITNEATGHTYEAYQIFTGEMDDSGVLGNIDWGTGVNSDGLLAKVQAIKIGTETPFADCEDAADVAKVLADETAIDGGGTTADAEITKAFAEVIGENLSKTCVESTEASGKYSIEVPDGYYLVRDSADAITGYDVKTSYIVQVANGTVPVTPKSGLPEVDKQVLDETADAETGSADGWGETADHAINEVYSYKLIAKIPANKYLADYDYYKLVFNDTMADGVTFDSIESVTVTGYDGNVTYTAVDSNNVAMAAGAEGSWTLTIDDITEYDTNLADGATVTVIYKAHLNEEATRYASSQTTATDNANTVSLSYTNNPYWDGTEGSETDELGETPEDTVWVFAYDINITKTDGTDPLNGAGFRLYSDADCKTEVAVIWDADMGAYRLVTGTEAGEEMTSGKGDAEGTTSGKITIAGLDTGTYYLKETNTPAGYNTCSNETIKISATHVENENEENVTITLSADTNNTLEVVNQAGSSLPSTGGIGTTLFYVGGGALALGAGVLLVSKKRMANK